MGRKMNCNVIKENDENEDKMEKKIKEPIKKDKSIKLLILIGSLSFLGSCISYFYLNQQIPIHWNVRWEVDSYAAKEYIFLIGASPLLLLGFMEVFKKVDPKRNNYEKHRNTYRMTEALLVLLFIMITWCTIAVGMNASLNIRVILPILLGFIFLALGNYLPRVKSNFFLGVKTPWALSNELCWRKTNRFGGYLFAIIGLLFVIGGFLQQQVIFSLAFAVLILGSVGNYVYSYVVYKKITKE